ncbi:MAG: hypothetical protein ACFCUU_12245 [Cyclobacteriaceae bacterium]
MLFKFEYVVNGKGKDKVIKARPTFLMISLRVNIFLLNIYEVEILSM